jgi:hypothetical protein
MLIGLSQFLDLARHEKASLKIWSKASVLPPITDIIRLKLAGIGQIALQHVTIADEVANIIKLPAIRGVLSLNGPGAGHARRRAIGFSELESKHFLFIYGNFIYGN